MASLLFPNLQPLPSPPGLDAIHRRTPLTVAPYLAAAYPAGMWIRIASNHHSTPLPPPCRYVDQGGGKRKCAFAIYMEPWHSDVFQFLDLNYNTGW
jgi:hypothetical protein